MTVLEKSDFVNKEQKLIAIIFGGIINARIFHRWEVFYNGSPHLVSKQDSKINMRTIQIKANTPEMRGKPKMTTHSQMSFYRGKHQRGVSQRDYA